MWSVKYKSFTCYGMPCDEGGTGVERTNYEWRKQAINDFLQRFGENTEKKTKDYKDKIKKVFGLMRGRKFFGGVVYSPVYSTIKSLGNDFPWGIFYYPLNRKHAPCNQTIYKYIKILWEAQRKGGITDKIAGGEAVRVPLVNRIIRIEDKYYACSSYFEELPFLYYKHFTSNGEFQGEAVDEMMEEKSCKTFTCAQKLLTLSCENVVLTLTCVKKDKEIKYWQKKYERASASNAKLLKARSNLRRLNWQ